MGIRFVVPYGTPESSNLPARLLHIETFETVLFLSLVGPLVARSAATRGRRPGLGNVRAGGSSTGAEPATRVELAHTIRNPRTYSFFLA